MHGRRVDSGSSIVCNNVLVTDKTFDNGHGPPEEPFDETAAVAIRLAPASYHSHDGDHPHHRAYRAARR